MIFYRVLENGRNTGKVFKWDWEAIATAKRLKRERATSGVNLGAITIQAIELKKASGGYQETPVFNSKVFEFNRAN